MTRWLRSHRFWDGVLLLFTVGGSAALWLSHIETLLPPGTSPPLFAAMLVTLGLATCILNVLVLNEAALIESWGAWVGVVTRVLQAGLFAVVLLFLPLPSFLLKFFASFLIAGEHWTIKNLVAHDRTESGASGASMDRGTSLQRRLYIEVRNSIVIGLTVGILGTLAIIAFIGKFTTGFNPHEAVSGTGSAAVPSSVGGTRNLLLVGLWTAIGLTIVTVNFIRRRMLERSQKPSRQAATSSSSKQMEAPTSPDASTPARAVRDQTEAHHTDLLARIGDLVNRGDISAIRFDHSLSAETLLVKSLPDEAIQSLMSGALRDILRRLPKDLPLDLEIRRTFQAGAEGADVEKTILVRRGTPVRR